MKRTNLELLITNKALQNISKQNIQMPIKFWNMIENNINKIEPLIETYQKLIDKLLTTFDIKVDENGKLDISKLSIERQQEFELETNDLLNIETEVEFEKVFVSDDKLDNLLLDKNEYTVLKQMLKDEQ